MRRVLVAVLTTALLVIPQSAWAAGGDLSPGFGSDPGMSPPGWWVMGVILTLGLAIGSAVWRMSVARGAAKRAGMDPDEAAAMSLLSDHGLEATYLTSQVRQTLAERADTSTEGRADQADERTVTERLAELDSLKQRGLVTDEEYTAKRADILEDL